MENPGSKNVLITGGTGMIGCHLTYLLINKGYNVAYVSRSAISERNVKVFQWDLKSEYLEPGAVEWSDYIVHLAGAGIADKRWSKKRKKVIRDSRVKSAGLLIKKLNTETHNVKALISASAIGFYGDTNEEWADEKTPPANDFMGRVASEWEEVPKKAKELGIRVCSLRTGIVLSKEGGALPKLALPVKYFVGAPLGTGKQYMSWIHLDDIIAVYLKAIEDDEMHGPYNAVAPHPVTNKQFTKTLAAVLHRPLFLPPIPGFALKIALGEMANTVLMSSRISNQKLIDAGFEFKFDNLKDAIKDLY
jgi:uncharacterized protein